MTQSAPLPFIPTESKPEGPESSERLKRLRRAARERFESLPWPVRTDEEWRRTDPGKIPLSKVELEPAEPALSVGWETPSPEMIRSGVILTDLETGFRQFRDLIEEHLFTAGEPQGLLKFGALHQAFWKQGLFCWVPDGVRVELPLKARLSLARPGAAVFPHLLVVVGRGSELTLIDERFSGENAAAPSVSDEMTEIVLKGGAALQYVRLQRWGRSVTDLLAQRTVLERDARLLQVNIGLGGGLTKAHLETVLREPGSRAELLGVLFGTEDQHFDVHTLQDHRAPSTFSDLLYKSALKDRARAIYTGLIRIAPTAQKSDAYQANRNLLLSPAAKSDSVPMLEIEADDVHCTHGVAVGPVDEEQKFYLMSRGLPAPEAERLIVEGFFDQVFRRLPSEALREELAAEVVNRL